MAHTIVVSQSRLDALRAQIVPTASHISREDQRAAQRRLADDAAVQRADTLKAERAAKELVRQERLAAAESALLEVDRRHAELQWRERAAKLATASRTLFERSDAAKGLRGRALLSDVLAEREAQIALHRRRAEQRARADALFVTRQQAAAQVAEEEVMTKRSISKAAALHQRDVQLQQLEELKHRILADRARDRDEGETIKQRAGQEAAEALQKEVATRAAARQANADTRLANDVLMEYKALDVQRELQVDASVAVYAGEKEAREKAQRQQLAEREAEREARRARMVAIMENHFMQAQARTESRLAVDVKEMEDRSAEDAEGRAEKRLHEWRAIDRSRKSQLAEQQAGREARRAADRAEALAMSQGLAQCKEQEAKAARQALEVARAHITFVEHQAARKAAAKELAQQAALQEAALRQWGVKEAEERFSHYARECVVEWAGRGRDVKPMMRYLAASNRQRSALYAN